MTRTRGTKAVLAALLALALTGCMRVDMDLDVSADETVDGEIVIAMSDQLISMSGQSADDLLNELQTDDLPDNAEVQEYEEDGYTGARMIFDSVPFEEWNDGEGLRLELQDDEIAFTATFADAGMDQLGDLDDPETQAQLEMLGGMPEMSVAVTFPGEVIESNGTVDGTTVTWDMEQMTGGEDLTARSETGGAGGFPIWLIILLVVVVIAAAIAALLFASKKKNKDEAVAGSVYEPGHPAGEAGTGPAPAPGSTGFTAPGVSTTDPAGTTGTTGPVPPPTPVDEPAPVDPPAPVEDPNAGEQPRPEDGPPPPPAR